MRDTKNEVLGFWFEELHPQQWFHKNPDIDAEILSRFKTTYNMATQELCNHWAADAHGALALVIVLDQFPRHMFRGTPLAFQSDKQALLIAKQAVSSGFDQVLDNIKRGFLYIPFQHSEEMVEQERSLELYGAMRDVNPTGFTYAKRHYDVIKQYGRFPHRNPILGRESTPDEQEYLDTPGSGF